LTRGAFDEEARFFLALPRIGVAMSNLQPEDLDSEVELMRRG
jgi:hypothetical protein